MRGKREKGGREEDREMRGNETEKTKNKTKRIAKICTCKHHTSTESNHEENTGFTLVLL